MVVIFVAGVFFYNLYPTELEITKMIYAKTIWLGFIGVTVFSSILTTLALILSRSGTKNKHSIDKKIVTPLSFNASNINWGCDIQTTNSSLYSAVDYRRTEHGSFLNPAELSHGQYFLADSDNSSTRIDEQLCLAAIAFETHEGAFIANKEGVIVRINSAFSEITGYHAEDVIGKKASILSSGRHDNYFYVQFWESINNTGKFAGEIWNRRKNGEIFPQWETVTAVKDEQGNAVHYVALFSDITQRKNDEKSIRDLAFYDPLTTLANRRLLNDCFSKDLAKAKRHGRIGALLYLDLDGFKHVNDEKGHYFGDQVLVDVAARLKENLREEDTPARIGGDEFVVLMAAEYTGFDSAEQSAKALAEKIRESLNNNYILAGHSCVLSASIGIALYSGDSSEISSVLRQADQAMYKSKINGKNTITVYAPAEK